MATLSVQTALKTGITPSQAAVAGGGDQFLNNGKVMVWLTNAHGADPRTITFVTQATTDGLAVADRPVVITAANDDAFVCDLDPNVYNDSSGYCQMTYSDAGADLTVGVFALTGT